MFAFSTGIDFDFMSILMPFDKLQRKPGPVNQHTCHLKPRMHKVPGIPGAHLPSACQPGFVDMGRKVDGDIDASGRGHVLSQ